MKNMVKNISPYTVTAVIAAVLVFTVPFFGFGEHHNNSTPYPQELYAVCFDGIDNDGDGFTDANDPDCPRCFDGIDNDGDRGPGPDGVLGTNDDTGIDEDGPKQMI